jgi:3-oxoacyl-[acyl-carrier-protein] synthase II
MGSESAGGLIGGYGVSLHRVAVTGLGIVTALGDQVPSVWRRLCAGENGIRLITYFDASQYACRVAAEVCDLPAPAWDLQHLPPQYCRRTARLFLHAAREAHADAGLATAGLPAHRVGVAAGTTVNYVHIKQTRYLYRFRQEGPPGIDLARLACEGEPARFLFFRRQGEMPSVLAAKAFGLAGPNLAVDTACAASAYAIGEAFRMVRRGQVDAMVAGGACAIVSPVGILAFTVLGALSRNPDPEEASRPFDRRRDGFVMGEGWCGGAQASTGRFAGADLRRDRRLRHHLNASTLTDPRRTTCEERALRQAMEDASWPGGPLLAAGTSTLKNDATGPSPSSAPSGPAASRSGQEQGSDRPPSAAAPAT